MTKKLPPLPKGERVRKEKSDLTNGGLRYVIEDQVRGYRYSVMMIGNKMRSITAGCRYWETFDNAKHHYRKDWQRRNFYILTDAQPGASEWEEKRLKALQRIARLEFEVKRHRANLRASWLGKKAKRK